MMGKRIRTSAGGAKVWNGERIGGYKLCHPSLHPNLIQSSRGDSTPSADQKYDTEKYFLNIFKYIRIRYSPGQRDFAAAVPLPHAAAISPAISGSQVCSTC
jgi:hypothetical protein